MPFDPFSTSFRFLCLVPCKIVKTFTNYLLTKKHKFPRIFFLNILAVYFSVPFALVQIDKSHTKVKVVNL